MGVFTLTLKYQCFDSPWSDSKQRIGWGVTVAGYEWDTERKSLMEVLQLMGFRETFEDEETVCSITPFDRLQLAGTDKVNPPITWTTRILDIMVNTLSLDIVGTQSNAGEGLWIWTLQTSDE